MRRGACLVAQQAYVEVDRLLDELHPDRVLGESGEEMVVDVGPPAQLRVRTNDKEMEPMQSSPV